MTFSAQIRPAGIEWGGASLDAVFAQRANLFRPAFWNMLAEIVRFNRIATRAGARHDGARRRRARRFGRRFPARASLLERLSRLVLPADDRLHLVVPDRADAALPGRDADPLLPQPRPAAGHRSTAMADGARRLALLRREDRRRTRRRAAGARRCGAVRRLRRRRRRRHDRSPAASASTPSSWPATATSRWPCWPTRAASEREVLGAIRYQRNRAILHTDASLLPLRRRAWAAWNYERAPGAGDDEAAVCLHYLINRLQPLPFTTPVIVSLNPVQEPRRGVGAGRVPLRPSGATTGAPSRRRRASPALQGRGRHLVLRRLDAATASTRTVSPRPST